MIGLLMFEKEDMEVVLLLTSFISISIVNSVMTDTSPGEVHQICRTQTFHAHCPRGHVIRMEKALYGRMTIGRCATRDVGICIHDVFQFFESMCGGQTECSYIVGMDKLLHQFETCPTDSPPYLEVEYFCVSKIESGDIQLAPSEDVPISTGVITVLLMGLFAGVFFGLTLIGSVYACWKFTNRQDLPNLPVPNKPHYISRMYPSMDKLSDTPSRELDKNSTYDRRDNISTLDRKEPPHSEPFYYVLDSQIDQSVTLERPRTLRDPRDALPYSPVRKTFSHSAGDTSV